MTGATRVQSGTAPVNGTEFYYEIAGEGEPLVLVHAGIADRRMWDGQFEELARHYKVIRYDRRGFGKTPMTPGPFSHYGDLAGLLDYLGVPRARFVGCSQGGKAVIDFALLRPEAVIALILVGSALSGFEFNGEAPAQFAAIEESASRGDIDLVNELELQIWVDGPGEPPGRARPAVRELVREMNKIALSAPEIGVEQELDPPAVGRLGEIRAPTLVVLGGLDTPESQEISEILAGQIPGAKRAVMVDTAHLPNMERPDEWNALALHFLKG